MVDQRSQDVGVRAAPAPQHGNLQQPTASPLRLTSSILPHRASLLPKNSLGALLLDFRASLRAPLENQYGYHSNSASLGLPRDSTNDLENVLMHLTSGDAHVLSEELETVSSLIQVPVLLLLPCNLPHRYHDLKYKP